MPIIILIRWYRGKSISVLWLYSNQNEVNSGRLSMEYYMVQHANLIIIAIAKQKVNYRAGE